MSRLKAIRIGSRGSQLAMRQAEWVREAMQRCYPKLEFEVRKIVTSGDRLQETPIHQLWGKGVFAKEIEEALLAEEIDIAVHSLKDLPTFLPDGLTIAAIPPRENPQDVLITNSGHGLRTLPLQATIGTSSIRRRVQLLAYRSDLRVEPLRGNLDTRLRKLAEKERELDAIVVAAAGLTRLGLSGQIVEYLPIDQVMPAAGQGALALEVRQSDHRARELLKPLDHEESRLAVTAERTFLQRLGGGCQVPIAALGRLQGETLSLQGLVATPEGKQLLRDHVQGHRTEASALGTQLAERLLLQGAAKILEGAQGG